jgi:uncharacterized GH25 family protein
MKKILALIFLLIFSVLLFAHEFWLQPDKFIYKWNDPIHIKFLVGENFEGENWKGDRSRINSLYLYFSGVKDDLSDLLRAEEGDSLVLKLLDEGTAMVIFNSNNSYIELDSSTFNAYLLEDGLNEAFQYRLHHYELDSTGREFYQRSAKTIFQVGKKYNNTYKLETVLPLDIIPQQNPYTLKNGDSLELKILFQQEPLNNHFIKIFQRTKNLILATGMISDENGIIKISIKPKGTWMISAVKMIRLEDDEKAQWQSYWGSCTWGYE